MVNSAAGPPKRSVVCRARQRLAASSDDRVLPAPSETGIELGVTTAKGNLRCMVRRIEHRSTSAWPAEKIHAALIDPRQIRTRLTEVGGSNAELVETTTAEDEVTIRTRQGVRAEHLPSIARNVVGGDLLFERSESWRRRGPDHFVGEVAVAIPHVPGSVTGSLWLRDIDDDETPVEAGGSEPTISEFVVEAEVRVNVPFVGGKLEDLVAEQVRMLLAEEARLAENWLAQQA